MYLRNLHLFECLKYKSMQLQQICTPYKLGKNLTSKFTLGVA